MSRKILLAAIVVLAIGLGAYIFFIQRQAPDIDPLNTTYYIDGQSVTLVDGRSEIEAAPGSVSKTTTMVFGEPVTGDLNGDGNADAAIFLTQSSGGSGTFYYVVAAIRAGDGNIASGTNAIFLGDRIAPQNIEIKDGRVIANYADRDIREPMTASPSIGVSKYLVYDGTALKEVAQ